MRSDEVKQRYEIGNQFLDIKMEIEDIGVNENESYKKSKFKFYSANYSYTNHNFIIQNLQMKKSKSKYIPAICILKNILQRGKPTLMSSFLQNEIGSIHKDKNFNKPYPLIDTEVPNWGRMIRGDDKNNNNPAKLFFEELIPKYLKGYEFIQQLIIPEIPIKDIVKQENKKFQNQQVDFYLPQAYLIIEIDGFHHKNKKLEDEARDEYTKKNRIKTIRINTKDLNEENEIFIFKMQEIKKRIDSIIMQEEKRNKNSVNHDTFIGLKGYKKSFEEGIGLNNPNYIATGIIRFQLLILELLEIGELEFDKDWDFELLKRDFEFNEKVLRLAVKDIFIWFKHLLILQKIEYKETQFNIKCVENLETFSKNDQIIKIDFSILKRYTDENALYPNIIFVRNDYLDEYLNFKKGNSKENTKVESKEYDYFKISTCKLIKYQLKLGENSKDKEALKFLLWNLFLQIYNGVESEKIDFREGQLPIIVNSLNRNDTLGLLPTGSGKSICYQLSAILQPGISFVVCPIKSLMYDQKSDLEKVFFTRTNYINSDYDGEEKKEIQDEFRDGKYQFIFISPERFQIQEFREYLVSVNKKFEIAYGVIDEVHCLSEWGHDFRISYLNLAYAINKYTPNVKILGLTATASIHVLKDIQIEFNIEDMNIKTPKAYTREELEFNVINAGKDKYTILKKELLNLKKDRESLEEPNSKCGIIFTPHVNGKNGCYPLSLELSRDLGEKVKYYSGSIPKKEKIVETEFNELKNQTQMDFKNNKVSLITATKAFGMGINKGNIYYTFHYGIPSSLEAFYQEAGRAGREKNLFQKNKAQCYILLSKSINEKNTQRMWDKNTAYQEFIDIDKKEKGLCSRSTGDINTQFFLFLNGMDSSENEFKLIYDLHKKYSQSGKKGIKIKGKSKIEKTVYRLKQLGIVKDWTVDFANDVLEVSYENYTEESIKKSLVNTIRKYDKEFSFENVEGNKDYSDYRKTWENKKATDIKKYMYILLQWSYNNVTYNRRQSLKNMYEIACKVADGEITKAEFKKTIEGYFKVSVSTYSFDQIAENPREFEEWFKIFYKKQSKKISENLIDFDTQKELISTLSRFLESYMENTGLDFISGFLRLMLDDYENTDGRLRLESSFKKINLYEEEKKQIILTNIFKLGKKINFDQKNKLSESIYKCFKEPSILVRIYKELEDTYSAIKHIEMKNYKKRLKNIEEIII